MSELIFATDIKKFHVVTAVYDGYVDRKTTRPPEYEPGNTRTQFSKMTFKFVLVVFSDETRFHFEPFTMVMESTQD